MNNIKELVKTLPKLAAEPNEVKRYILLNMWLSQFFTQTITEPVRKFEDKLTSGPSDTTSSDIYDLCRDIKVELQAKNKQLSEVKEKMMKQRDILLVLSKTLELDNSTELCKLTNNIKKVEGLISTNEDYVQRLSELSESRIVFILNDGKGK